MKFNDIMKEVLDNNKRESFKEAIEKLVFVDNETAKDAEDILKKYPSATRVKCVRMQRTLLFDNVKDKETAKAQLTDNGINGLSKQSLSSESFKEGNFKVGDKVKTKYGSGKVIEVRNGGNMVQLSDGDFEVFSDNELKKESYNASKLKSEYDRLLNSDMTTSDLQSALGVVVKSMFNYMDASYRDEIENILLQGLQASKQFSSIKMSIESKVGNYGLVHGR